MNAMDSEDRKSAPERGFLKLVSGESYPFDVQSRADMKEAHVLIDDRKCEGPGAFDREALDWAIGRAVGTVVWIGGGLHVGGVLRALAATPEPNLIVMTKHSKKYAWLKATARHPVGANQSAA